MEKLRLAGGGDPFISQAPLVLVFAANRERSSRRYGDRGATLYAIQDATIACAYAQLAATALGLGSVWVGAFDEELARSALGMGPELRPIAILPIGHPGEEPKIKERRSIDSLVHQVP
jgi:nitroreductase